MVNVPSTLTTLVSNHVSQGIPGISPIKREVMRQMQARAKIVNKLLSYSHSSKHLTRNLLFEGTDFLLIQKVAAT